MCLFFPEKSKRSKLDENGELHQWLWKQKFMKNVTLKLITLLTIVTMSLPMRLFPLDRETEYSQDTSNKVTLSIFVAFEPKKTLKLTSDTLDCDDILVNKENDSVPNFVRTWISTGKLPTKDVEAS